MHRKPLKPVQVGGNHVQVNYERERISELRISFLLRHVVCYANVEISQLIVKGWDLVFYYWIDEKPVKLLLG